MPGRRRGGLAEDEAIAPDRVITGRIWIRGRLQPMEIGLSDDGWIVEIGRSVSGPRRKDYGEAVIMPAGVDAHVHFREPGPPDSADSFSSGTLQAALGGISLVGEMPNTLPPVRDRENLEAKADRARGRSACDVLLFGLAQTPVQVRRLTASVGAYKVYLSPTTGVPDPPPASERSALLEALRSTDLPISVHAEDPAGFAGAAAPASDLAGWDATRPGAAERAAVEGLVERAGPSRLHVAHVTQADIAGRIRRAGYSLEATPHHLLLSTRSKLVGALAKVNPPLRSEATRAGLFDAFARGEIPVLASDHAPHSPESKSAPFALAPSGVPGVETMLPLFLGLVAQAKLSFPVVQSAASERPSRWFGVPMGRIAPGHRANLLVVDFRRREPIRGRRLHSPSAETPFEGWEAVFPQTHYLSGELIVDGGEYVGRRSGRVLRPEFARTSRAPLAASA